MSKSDSRMWSSIIILGIFIIVSLSISIAKLVTIESVSITVVDKERVAKKESSKYLIFTENEVFENTDYWLVGKFNSSDIYGKLSVGKSYQVKVCGWRIPFLSAYRNIIEIESELK